MKLSKIIKEYSSDDLPISTEGKNFVITVGDRDAKQLLMPIFQDIFSPSKVKDIDWNEIDIEEGGRIIADRIDVKIDGTRPIDISDLVYNIQEFETLTEALLKYVLYGKGDLLIVVFMVE